MYARGPAGPIAHNAQFTVQVYLNHTNNISTNVWFRFHFDPSVVDYNGLHTTDSPYATHELGNMFNASEFDHAYTAIVSPQQGRGIHPGGSATLVCTLKFTAKRSGAAVRMSVRQVLGKGEYQLIKNPDFLPFDVLGGNITLVPPSVTVGILSAVTETLANLQNITGTPSSLTPRVVKVKSGSSHSDVTGVTPQCRSHSNKAIRGCIRTTTMLGSGNASVVVYVREDFLEFNRTVHFRTYKPTITVNLSRPHVGQLCDGVYQSTDVRVFADGLDVTASANISGDRLQHNSSTQTLHPDTAGVFNVYVANVWRAQLNVSNASVEGALLHATAISTSNLTQTSSAATAKLEQTLEQEHDSAEVYAVLKYDDNTYEVLGDLVVVPTHQSITTTQSARPTLTLLQDARLYHGPVADVRWTRCNVSGVVSAFLNVPQVVSAFLTQETVCLARQGARSTCIVVLPTRAPCCR